jgi:hypothetical protein
VIGHRCWVKQSFNLATTSKLINVIGVKTWRVPPTQKSSGKSTLGSHEISSNTPLSLFEKKVGLKIEGGDLDIYL